MNKKKLLAIGAAVLIAGSLLLGGLKSRLPGAQIQN